jgi:hypothetical protein
MHGQIQVIPWLALVALLGVGCTSRGGEAQPVGEPFAVSLQVGEPVAVGQPGELVIRIEAKQGFKVNQEYPHSFRPQPTEGVRFAEERYRLSGSKEQVACPKSAEDTCTLVERIEVEPTAQGSHRISGQLSFSVCDAERCLIEKRELSGQLEAN